MKAFISIAMIATGLIVSTASNAWLEGEEHREKAMELEPDLGNGFEVYRLCADCHRPEGWGSEDGAFPMIAGQHRNVLIKQMTDIGEGNRDNPSMYPFSLQEEIGGEQAIADVTAYIASLPMNPNAKAGDGQDLDYGKQLYNQHCASCHGINGEGSDESFYPRIQGQNYPYLLRQLNWIQNGKRRNANPVMVIQIKQFGQREFSALADYISRLKPPAALLAEPDWVNPDFINAF